MNTLKKIAAGLALAGFATLATAQVVVQDGIPVRKLSKARLLAPEETVEAQSKLQYLEMMQKAQQAGALAPASDRQLLRLRAIAKRIIPFATRWNPAAAKWDWQVNLVQSDEVNAFCMPGGRVGFYSGILTKLQLNDDEVAAIMGHEIAHALREHGRAQMGKSMATNTGARIGGALIAKVFDIDPGLTETVADYGAKAVSLKFSRDDEREADLIGLDLASRAGFDPRAGASLWEKMASLNNGKPPVWMSTHPSDAGRIGQINAKMGLLLPVYARAKGTTVRALPQYSGVAMK
jgi:Zn-dependent protease with chaperone function